MREHGRLFYVYDYVFKFNCKIKHSNRLPVRVFLFTFAYTNFS